MIKDKIVIIKYIKSIIDIEFIKKLLEVAEIKIMTLAPELNGIDPLLDFMQKNKIKIHKGVFKQLIRKNLTIKIDLSMI